MCTHKSCFCDWLRLYSKFMPLLFQQPRHQCLIFCRPADALLMAGVTCLCVPIMAMVLCVCNLVTAKKGSRTKGRTSGKTLQTTWLTS